MSNAERVELLDAAMRSRSPIAYLRGVGGAFEHTGRAADALTTTAISAFYGSGDIETLMFMRARWAGRRMKDRPPATRSA